MPGRPVDYSRKLRKTLEDQLATVQAELAALVITYPGELRHFALASPPSGWLEANGAAVLITTYPALAAAIYCGDGANATADWGYRATQASSPSTHRSTSGTYIVLPDFRGQFLRGWDNGRGLDPARSLWADQDGAFESHTHTATADAVPAHSHTGTALSAGNHSHGYFQGTVTTNNNTTATGSSNRVVTYDDFVTQTGDSGIHTHTLSINDGGGHTPVVNVSSTGDVETRPTNLAALICIKT